MFPRPQQISISNEADNH